MKIKFLHTLILCFTLFSVSLNAQNSLAVTVFEDVDGNGLEDIGEPVINGVTTLELQLWQDVDMNGSINAEDIEWMHDGGIGGVYTFGTGNVLPDDGYILLYNEAGGPGSYYVTKLVNGVGTMDSDNDVDPMTNSATFGLVGDSPETLIDLGLVIAGNIGSFVWEDSNGDGIQDGGENGIDGLNVTLLDATTMLNVTQDIDFLPLTNPAVTAGGGTYTFDNLPPGQYIVEFTAPTPSPNPWYPTVSAVETDATDVTNDSDAENNSAAANYLQSHTIILLSDETDEEDKIDAGFFQASIIGDMVWEDLNGDGIQDAGEPGIDGVTVSLLDDLGAAAIGADGLAVPDQITAGGGLYQFTLVAPGDYQVQFNLPAPIAGVNWYPTEFDNTHTDANDPDIDSDANNDAADVANYLKSHVITIVSDEETNGNDNEDTRIDAGFWLPAMVGNKVFCDVNGNGVDDGEAGVDGVDVRMINVSTGATAQDADGVDLTTTTAGGGIYNFDLVPPGDYRIEFSFTAAVPGPPFTFTLQDDPDGLGTDFTDSDADPNPGGTQGQTEEFNIISQDTEEEEKWDAGVYQAINILGNVWIENDANLMYDGESGPGAVMLELFDSDGNKIDEAFTNAGDYEFIGLPPGDYYIQFNTVGTPLESATPCAGFNDANDMVDNDDNGNDDPLVQTTIFTLESNCDVNNPPEVVYIDFCYFFDCNEPNMLAATACDEIIDPNIICDISILGTFCNLMPTEDSPGNQPQPLCPDGGAPHNMSWFAFVAYGGSYTITVTPTGCTGSTTGIDGVQIGLYTDCTFTEEVYCNPDCNLDPVTFDSSVLEEGQTYYFFIDGCSSSVCSYEVVIDGAPQEPSLLPDDVCIDNNGVLECEDAMYCPDALVDFVVTDFNLTVDFTWSVTTVSGTPYTGDPAPMTEDEILSISFPDEGVYQVCITQVDNGCLSQQWNGNICREITIEGIDDEEFTDQIICEEDLVNFNLNVFDTEDPNTDGTAGWQDPSTAVDFGTVTGFVTTPEGCMYEQEFELMMHPESEKGLYEQTLCRDELPIIIDGTQYTEISFAGDLVLSIPDLPIIETPDVNGCDSVIDLSLEVLDIFNGTLTEGICTPDGVLLLFEYGTEADGFPSTEEEFITWEWTAPDGDILPDDIFDPSDILNNIATIDEGSGTYTLTATIVKNGVSCMFTYDVMIDFDQLLPPTPNITAPGLDVCESDPLVTYTAVDLGDATLLTWVYPNDVASATFSGALDEEITIDWTGSAGGTVSLFTNNGCGDSELIEIEVTVVPQATPAFDFTAEVCTDSCTIIEFMGDVTDIDVFDWDFDGGTENNGTGSQGPGPHCVSWSDSGDKTITLSYTDLAGCVSTVTTEIVSVIAPITPPVINCNPNTGEVSFTWDDVPDNTGYSVEVTSTSIVTGDPHTGTLNGTTFTVTGLQEGETVTIILTIMTMDACQMITVSSPGCTSQDCIAPTIDLDADVTTFCLDPTTGTATITADITSGETGTGTFVGPGIVDPINGIFDPDSANIGINTITYQFMTDDPVPCLGNQTIQIEVNETPTASFVSDVDTICISGQFNLMYDGTNNVNTLEWDYGLDGTGNDGTTPSVTYTTPGEKTITLMVTKDNCQSEVVEYTVFVQPEVEQVMITCSIQEIDQVQFSWNAVPGATGYLVSVDGGTPFVTTDTFHGETGLSPDDMVTITVTVITDSKCPPTMDEATCTAVSCPTFTFSYDDPVQDICVDGTNPLIDLQALASGGDGTGTYTWSGTNVTNAQFDPNGLPEGSYDLFVTYEENSCEESGSVTVNITTIPTAAFSVDNNTICVGETVNLLYEGSQLPGQTISWTSGGEDVVPGANPNEYSSTFNAVGTFDITLDVENGACSTTPASASITVEPELVFDTINCLEDLDQIFFSWAPVDCATEYEVFIDGTSQGIQSTTDFTATGLSVGQEVTIEVIAVSGCACGNVMKTRICEAQDCTPVDLSLSTMDGVTEFCLTEGIAPVEIIAETIGTMGSGTSTWSGPGVDQNGMFDPTAAGIGTHVIVFDFLESAGCPYQESITFIVNELPEVSQQYEELSCYDQTTTLLEVLPMGGDGDYTITLNGADADLMNDVEPGTYEIIVSDGNMCSATTSVTIAPAAEPTINISGSAELVLGDSSSYSINNVFTGETVDSIIWIANGEVICNDPACFNIGTQMPLQTTDYEVTVYYNSGCSVFATFTVVITDPPIISVFEIPNIISPNNDGDNDEWKIVSNDENIVVNSVSIFDRWGNNVWAYEGSPFNAKDNNITWDGKFNDKVLQPGVYVFFVNFNDAIRDNNLRTGSITIIN
ncbi:MAG: SdrD B-like domain-containing protein [Saprospiraceae bacterium]|nr:SdrD B-like domain-containing protein [Saprospiraceae bacterium]